MQTDETMKNNIKSRLIEMVESRRELIGHINFLNSIGVDVDINRNRDLYLSNSLESVAGTYIEHLCKKLTQEHAAGTPAEIEIDSAAYKVITNRDVDRSFSSRFGDDKVSCLNDEKLLINTYLDMIDFKLIASQISEQTAQLKVSGLNILANRIISQFSMNHMDSSYAPIQKKARIHCHSWTVNYWQSYEKVKDIAQTMNAFQLIESDAGINFSGSIELYLEGVQKLSSRQENMPPRTVYGKGTHLEIHCFKEKHEFRFSLQAFDAILAFLTINGEEAAANAVMASIYVKEAA
jgi:hypothetical protein